MEKYSKGVPVSWQSVALGAGVGVAATMLLIIAFAAVLASVDLPESSPVIIASVCIGLGALLGGFVSAKRNGHSGLLCGLLCGAVVFLLFAFVALIIGSDIGITFIIRLLVALLFGGIGGIMGINLRRKRKYI